MKIVLEDIRDKLHNGYYQNEEHIRLSLVARVLFELEWNIWNPQEVNSEFTVLPHEDSTRVDIALFLNTYAPPSVFIEIKSVRKIEQQLSLIETQLRDYNRNNTSMFTILTDGIEWRFYYSQTGGEFSNKCFKVLNLLDDEIEDIESSFYTFLSKAEIEAENAKVEAESYLKLSQKQRALEDALPKAKRLTHESPYPSLPDAIMNIVSGAGFNIDRKEVISFIQQECSEQKGTIKKSYGKTFHESLTAAKNTTPAEKKFFLPPENTKCRFIYMEQQFDGIIRNKMLQVEGYNNYKTFSAASKDITNTSRNGWRDWELNLPGQNEWILADKWRKK